MADKRRLSA